MEPENYGSDGRVCMVLVLFTELYTTTDPSGSQDYTTGFDTEVIIKESFSSQC
jgi:hypothetical protein